MKEKRKFSYYNFDRLYSFAAFIMVVVGARGLGKTFGAKRKCITRALKTGEQFIYLRRHKTDMKKARATFFDDIASFYPDWDFRVMGDEAQAAPIATRDDKKRAWQVIGHFAVLSVAQSIKSVSFERVTTIIFDEFIIERGHVQYLQGEVTTLLNFYNTVDRGQDKTRLLMLANSVTIMNPYFHEWNVSPSHGEWQLKNDGALIVNFAKSDAYEAEVLATRFGKFIAGTEYAQYAAGNTFLDNNDNLLRKKPASASYLFTLETKGGTYSIWHTYGNGEYFAQAKRPKVEDLCVMDSARQREGATLLQFSDWQLKVLRASFKRANLYFDTPKARNAMVEVFDRK